LSTALLGDVSDQADDVAGWNLMGPELLRSKGCGLYGA
jgi:hypothetical protein